MRVIVLGASGMLGHKMVQGLSTEFSDVLCTFRSSASRTPWADRPEIFGSAKKLFNVNVEESVPLERLLSQIRPDVIVNCAGIIKQREEAQSAIESITVNSLLPHRLAKIARGWGGRVIHFSTDCVFSGRRGQYTEADTSDAEDLYGRTKFLGEVAESNALTLRTSIIGRELHHRASLLEWFLAQAGGRVRGFTRAWWSGVTTNHLADFVVRVVKEHPDLAGLYQLSSGRMSKYELLCRLRDAFKLAVEMEPSEELFCDRSLCGDRLREATGYVSPSWDVMLHQLVSDSTTYDSAGVR